MPLVDVLQETFVAAAPRLVADALAEPAVAADLWPDLTVTVTQRRGLEGQRYAVHGAWRGTAELWLEPCADGVLVHSYLRLDPTAGPVSARVARREADRRQRTMRWGLWRHKDRIEAGRAPGEAAVGTMVDRTAR
ncbi:polyketide cyclase / dehydrase and lipid transport [Actinocatenispora comari]|jgi:hypothetical protein|uniref:Polyketide cyclase / dehydrase and lipid transport n=1 Tax=Actinocatenispora comari TaxID=2807577 RepID=A0A8J4EM39_9ACTN|nr:polyketide cyclase / dehydrase and lipid transport [Actinocatenispora comari]GIL28810.1 hypothetical protein NUM_40640 [Actinocatenispora comari]